MDGIPISELNMNSTGNSLAPKDWHEKCERLGEKTTMIDCRNYFESEIGRFEGAQRLPITKHLDSFDEIDKILETKPKDEQVMIVRALAFGLLEQPKFNLNVIAQLSIAPAVFVVRKSRRISPKSGVSQM